MAITKHSKLIWTLVGICILGIVGFKIYKHKKAGYNEPVATVPDTNETV